MSFIGAFDETMPQSMEEFYKRYDKSWMEAYFPETGVRDLFFVCAESSGMIALHNSIYDKVLVKQNTETKLKPVFVKAGMFQLGQEALVAYRVPVRRNQRSTTAYNTKIVGPFEKILGTIGSQRDLTYEAIKAALKERYFPDIYDCLDRVSDFKSIAVSNEYMISKVDGRVFIWYNYLPIGEFRSKEHVTIDKHFWQEFRDFVHRNNYSIQVEAV